MNLDDNFIWGKICGKGFSGELDCLGWRAGGPSIGFVGLGEIHFGLVD